MFYNLRKDIPYKFKLQLFNAYVYSRVSYGNHCYGAANKTVVKPVQIVCNKLLKVFLMKHRKYFTNLLFKGCNLLKMNDLNKFLAAKIVHRSVYPTDNTPEQLRNYFVLNVNVHDRDVRDKLLVRLPDIKSAFGEKCLHWFGAYYWNRIDARIRNIKDIKIFKKELKTSILNSY